MANNQVTPLTPEERQVLLAEYQTCQQDVHSQASRYWVIVSIFMPVSTVLLGWIVQSILTKDLKELTDIVKVGMILAILFCIAMVIILVSLLRWVYRINSLNRISYFRMSEIESQLGMLKHRLVDWLDHPKKMPNDQKERLRELSMHHKRTRETSCFEWIIYTLISMWAILALFIIAIVSGIIC